MAFPTNEAAVAGQMRFGLIAPKSRDPANMVYGMTIRTSEIVNPNQLCRCCHSSRPASVVYTRKVSTAPLSMMTPYVCKGNPHDVQTDTSAWVNAAKLQSLKTPGTPAQGTISSK